eukprot:2075036-Pleurochrysis_carterae.AAC.1
MSRLRATTASTRPRTSSLTFGSLSGPIAYSTRPRNKTTSCWRAVTTAVGTAPSAASVPVYLPLENTAAQTASP